MESQSVKLIHTERLGYQLLAFLSKLQQLYKKVPLPLKQQCYDILRRTPPWACRVLASEFAEQEDFHRFCNENKQYGLHSKWTEFEEEQDFLQIFKNLIGKGTCMCLALNYNILFVLPFTLCVAVEMLHDITIISIMLSMMQRFQKNH